AHLEILRELSTDNITANNFKELHQAWEKALDIQVLNNKFYTEIAKHYYALVNHKDFRMPSDDFDEQEKKENFVVRLIGRIIFCWFLNKKKAKDGLPLIPDYVLDRETVKKGNYYKDILEKLFFEAMNKELKSRTVRSEMWDSIPFLNGGLFDPNQHHDCYNNGERNDSLNLPDGWFIGFYEFLSGFIFTIDENTPLIVELSVDPEMLGRIFENLLGEINPETNKSARKSTGSFYTPREIVDYMVDISLKAYLQSKLEITDEKLDDLFDYNKTDFKLSKEKKNDILDALMSVKILDPACGSGAYPMGILQRMFFIMQKLDPKSEYWLKTQIEEPNLRNQITDNIENENINYFRKLSIIQNCIYGIDIQQMATDISKLRFFLTLVIEDKLNQKDNRGITPLPNLMFKFITANTLVDLGLNRQDKFMTNIMKKYKQIIKDSYNARTLEEKKQIEDRFGQIKGELLESLNYQGKQITLFGEEKTKDTKVDDTIRKLISYNPFRDNNYFWFDPMIMLGVFDGFDLVIGNPPYVQLQDMDPGNTKELEAMVFKTYAPKGDLYCLFYEKGINMLKEEGHLCFITSNKWMRADYGKKLRAYFAKLNPKLLIDLRSGVFKSATVDTNILLIEKTDNKQILKALTYKNKGVSLSESVKNHSIILTNLSEVGWSIVDKNEKKLKEKIDTIGKPLKDWNVNIYYGIKTGKDKAFIIDNKTKDRLCQEDPTSAEIIKPYLRGKDISRYKYKWGEQWLLVTGKSLNIPNLYPAIFNYLKKYEKVAKARADQGDNWWNLRTCTYYDAFDKKKLIWAETSSELRFCIDKEKYYVNKTCFIVTGSNLEYICGIINSKLIDNIFRNQIANTLGEKTVQASKIYVERIPIPPITPSNQYIANEIEQLVSEIIKKKKDDEDTLALEARIDDLVCELYELTEEEKELVMREKVNEESEEGSCEEK
ncbi:MAG: BREX-1 system adenine-specific DNA-methyltransferase PglX, partial [Bacteroidia bacterium]|nr:BREX-1 system adenine-specific DNA-methyltransferase PglX [Bacteroidia bacterium]